MRLIAAAAVVFMLVFVTVCTAGDIYGKLYIKPLGQKASLLSENEITFCYDGKRKYEKSRSTDKKGKYKVYLRHTGRYKVCLTHYKNEYCTTISVPRAPTGYDLILEQVWTAHKKTTRWRLLVK